MKREIKTTAVNVKVLSESIDPVVWLRQQIDSMPSALLLAHADDGVIWGKVANGALVTMPEDVPLRMTTLQQARLFSPDRECCVWRDGDGTFHRRIVVDGGGETVEYFDEDQVLWGDRAEPLDNGFTKMSDGAQGLVHYVPIRVTKARSSVRPLRLTVRHYLHTDEHGFVRVAFSRLAALKEVSDVQ